MKKSWKLKAICTNLYHLTSVLPRYKQSFLVINVLIATFITLFTFSCGKVEKTVETLTEEENLVTELEVESKIRFKMHMSDLEDYYDDLADAVERQNWKEINKYAMQMKNTSSVILTGKRKEELPHDFVMMDTMFHLHTLALIEASEAKEMVKLNIEYDNVKQTCDNCHEKYKKKET
jgi:hypothetical protein